MNDFLKEMEEIIKKDFESNDSKHPDIYLKSYTTLNNNIYAYKLEDNYSVKIK